LANRNPVGRTANFADETLRLAIRLRKQLVTSGRTALGTLAIKLGNMTTLTTNSQPTRLIGEPQLDGFIAIAVGSADLQDVTRTGLNDRNRHDVPCFIKYLSCPDL